MNSKIYINYPIMDSCSNWWYFALKQVDLVQLNKYKKLCKFSKRIMHEDSSELNGFWTIRKIRVQRSHINTKKRVLWVVNTRRLLNVFIFRFGVNGTCIMRCHPWKTIALARRPWTFLICGIPWFDLDDWKDAGSAVMQKLWIL